MQALQISETNGLTVSERHRGVARELAQAKLDVVSSQTQLQMMRQRADEYEQGFQASRRVVSKLKFQLEQCEARLRDARSMYEKEHAMHKESVEAHGKTVADLERRNETLEKDFNIAKDLAETERRRAMQMLKRLQQSQSQSLYLSQPRIGGEVGASSGGSLSGSTSLSVFMLPETLGTTGAMTSLSARDGAADQADEGRALLGSVSSAFSQTPDAATTRIGAHLAEASEESELAEAGRDDSRKTLTLSSSRSGATFLDDLVMPTSSVSNGMYGQQISSASPQQTLHQLQHQQQQQQLREPGTVQHSRTIPGLGIVHSSTHGANPNIGARSLEDIREILRVSKHPYVLVALESRRQMEAKDRELSKRVEQLEEQQQSLTSKLLREATRLATTEAERSKLVTEVTSLRGSLQKRSASLAQAQDRLGEEMRAKAKLAEELDGLRNELAEAQRMVVSLQEQLVAMKATHAAAVTEKDVECNALKHDLQAEQVKREASDDLVSKFVEQVETLKLQLTAAEEALQTADSQVRASDQDVQALLDEAATRHQLALTTKVRRQCLL